MQVEGMGRASPAYGASLDAAQTLGTLFDSLADLYPLADELRRAR